MYLDIRGEESCIQASITPERKREGGMTLHE